MYHTFQIGHNAANRESDAQPRTANARRISTTLACNECRRRKIRCDGAQPCQQCVWYQHPELCIYPRQTRKVMPSRKILDGLQSRVDLLNGIFARLFPGQEPEVLASMSHGELLRVAMRVQHSSGSPSSEVPPSNATGSQQIVDSAAAATTAHSASSARTAPISSAGAESLSVLEKAPQLDQAAEDAQQSRLQNISDDVNALSISVRRQSSYVGVSSVSAALEVIFKTEPSARAYMAQSYTKTANPSRRNSQDDFEDEMDANALPSPDVGQRYIERYFNYVHPLMPMIDEQEFWNLYLYTNRTDASWLALLNMVLAMGSLALGDNQHTLFSSRARCQFSLEMFGSGNLFLLQALGLMNGYYMHWLSRPNEANALMGAALRMATAMGLHREFSNSTKSSTTEIPAETRRRTWWTLVCLDTWAAMTTGRPSLGRLGIGITVHSPKIPEQTNNAQYLASIKLLPIVHNVSFCKLATKVQDQLASLNILPPTEVNALDAELLRWHDDLPPILRDATPSAPAPTTTVSGKVSTQYPSPSEFSGDAAVSREGNYVACPELLRTPRLVMYWWYMTLRVLLHRPLLLASALRRLPFDTLCEEEQNVVAKCHQLAGQTIEKIDRACHNELLACWNGVWMMYQASMVPLVSLFAYKSLHTSLNGLSAARLEEVDSWQRQIATATQFFERMEPVIHIAYKCKIMLQRLSDASRIPSEAPATLPSSESALQEQDWNSEIAVLDHPYALPSTVVEDGDALAGGITLDDWLQTYDHDVDATAAWNDMLWSYAATGSSNIPAQFPTSASFPFDRPPMYGPPG